MTVGSGKVTSDWGRTFDQFAVWRPLRLLRRLGPVVQGITLDRNTAGDAYFPTVHIHVLAVPFPVISLTMGQRLLDDSGAQKQVMFSRHAEEFRVAVEGVRRQSSLSVDEPPGIVEVVRALHDHAKNRHADGHAPAVHEVGQSILVQRSARNKTWSMKESRWPVPFSRSGRGLGFRSTG